ncbi:MAG: alpha/beta hydrolase [Thermoanaerobaculia bacterium]
MADELFLKRIVFQVPGMEAVQVRRNIVYHRLKDGAEMKMDIYPPPDLAEGERRPAVVFIHGGPIPPGLDAKNLGLFKSYGELIAASGFVGVTFGYRYESLGTLAAGARQVEAAFTYVREHAAEFGVDTDRLAAWFFSGGGPQLAPFLRNRPAGVRCLLAYYTVLDLEPLRKDVPENQVERFSPVASFAPGEYEGPPILVARAGLDKPFMNAGIDAFVTRALAANATLDVMNHPRGEHGFDVLNDDARSREIIARSLDFLRTHL